MRAVNSPTPPWSSKRLAATWFRLPCWAPPWRELALLAADDPDADALEKLAEGSSIGAVVFDPGYVVNGDVADVVLRVRGRPARPLDELHRGPRRHHGSRPGGSRASSPGDTVTIGSDPGLADVAAILLAAEQIGAAARCLDLTVAYTKERVQFGRPIGSFQALKHRMADLYVLVQSARALVDDAIDEPSPDVGGAGAGRRQRGVHAPSRASPSRCTAASRITWEYDIQLYFKRAHGSAQLLGPPRDYLRRLEAEVL